MLLNVSYFGIMCVTLAYIRGLVGIQWLSKDQRLVLCLWCLGQNTDLTGKWNLLEIPIWKCDVRT